MDKFPKVHIGYIKVNDSQAPIRIETLNYPKNLIKDYEYILELLDCFQTMDFLWALML